LTSAAPQPLKDANEPLKMLVSRTRPAAEAVYVADRIGAELLPMGSAGAKAMAVVRGEADIYLHTGGQYEWDNCAPVAVAQAAGLHVSRVDGSPIRYNNPDTYLPDLLICRKELAADVLRLAAEYSRAEGDLNPVRVERSRDTYWKRMPDGHLDFARCERIRECRHAAIVTRGGLA
jgi:3'(2'), 5'-bisphosphate nucleotidase